VPVEKIPNTELGTTVAPVNICLEKVTNTLHTMVARGALGKYTVRDGLRESVVSSRGGVDWL
jgi:hypothetical protein